ncbi:MAG: hypothetical protein J1F20_03810 [Muribaculaceae bacterium]|nr:hypothetical protein [Muribaculaceae bacterium]
MGKILRVILSILAIAGVSGLSSCDSGGCAELRSAVPRADFFSMSTLKGISVDSLQIVGVGVPGDSVLYGPSSRLSTIYLPMPPLADRVQWRIAYMQELLAQYDLADTITLGFERTPYFAGIECGAMYKYLITEMKYTTNLIDSVAVTDSLVINVDKPTLAIYFRTE